MEEKKTGGKLRRVSFIADASDADVLGDEPIWHKGKVVGWATSGGYAHYVDKSMAQGYAPKELAGNIAPGAFEIEIIGENRKATIITEPLFDPEGKRMRGWSGDLPWPEFMRKWNDDEFCCQIQTC